LYSFLLFAFSFNYSLIKRATCEIDKTPTVKNMFVTVIALIDKIIHTVAVRTLFCFSVN
jgi:hypothetical protein